jgi:1,4-alpha-glucan branching enzyme
MSWAVAKAQKAPMQRDPKPAERTNKVNTTIKNPLRQHRYSAKRTRHHVTFCCDAPKAQSVRLVGDFNGWNLSATPMRRMSDGHWMADLELNHGHHRYVFVVDGEPQPDPKATGIARDDQNNRISVIAVS